VRNRLKPICLALFALGLAAQLNAQQATRTQNVILVTLDGFRWQEVFSGADSLLVANRKYVRDTTATRARFWAASADARSSTSIRGCSASMRTGSTTRTA